MGRYLMHRAEIEERNLYHPQDWRTIEVRILVKHIYQRSSCRGYQQETEISILRGR